MSFLEWWYSLSAAAQVFYCIAIPTTLLLLLQTVLMFLGIGGDEDGVGEIGGDDVPEIDPDFDELSDAAGMDSLHVFTVRGIIAFFVVFGWVGVLMEASAQPLYLTIPIAALSGFAMMLVIAYLLRAVMRLRNDGNTDNRNAIGASGKVHLTIPPERSGEGKVHVMLQGSYVERNAVTDDDSPIPTGSEIVVIGVSGQTDLVVRKK